MPESCREAHQIRTLSHRRRHSPLERDIYGNESRMRAVDKIEAELMTCAPSDVARYARGLLDVTGEYDRDGDWVACPQSSVSDDDRDAIAVWVRGWWESLYSALDRAGIREGAGGDRPHGEVDCDCGARFRAPLRPVEGDRVWCPHCLQDYRGKPDDAGGCWIPQEKPC